MSTGSRVFGSSIPKSGTHLLSAIFDKMGYSVVACRKETGTRKGSLPPEATTSTANTYAFGHWRYHEPHISALRENGYKVIVLIRDPRDICLSMADFIRKGQPRSFTKLDPGLQQLSQKEIVRKLLYGFSVQHLWVSKITGVCKGWVEWQEAGGIVLRYEDLARLERRPIAEVEKIGLDPDRFLEAAGQAFGNRESRTFNKGVVERWRTEFDDELKKVWRHRAKGLATLFGYEEV